MRSRVWTFMVSIFSATHNLSQKCKCMTSCTQLQCSDFLCPEYAQRQFAKIVDTHGSWHLRDRYNFWIDQNTNTLDGTQSCVRTALWRKWWLFKIKQNWRDHFGVFWRWFQYIYICFNMPEYVSMDVTTCFNPALIIRQEKVSQAPGWANQATGAVLSHEWRGSSPVCCSFSPAESSRASHAAGKRNAQWWGMMPASEGFGRTF